MRERYHTVKTMSQRGKNKIQSIALIRPQKEAHSRVAYREILEHAKKLESSGRYEEAARLYYELEMYDRAIYCKRILRGRVWDRRVQ